MRSTRSEHEFTGNRTAAIGLIVVCIVGTAILIAARTSEPTASAAVTTAALPAAAATPAVPAKTLATPARVEARAQAGETAAKAGQPERVTIEGCLVEDEEAFVLKNTAGEDAPKGRSWKSGFLKKSSKTIAVADTRHRLNLAGHVGERVSVTGMLDDRELQGSSLKRLAESCN